MNHGRLHCYQTLVDVAKAMPNLISALPRGEGYLIDQLKRALASAILNLSEGNSRYSQRERNRFFDISLGSIAESSSAIDIIYAYGYISVAHAQIIHEKLERAYAMVRNLKR